MKERNCYTKRDFLDELDFNAEIFQMSAREKFMKPTDEQVVLWAVYILLKRGWPTLEGPPHVFIITKDRRFEKSSKLKKTTKRDLKELQEKVMVITFDSKKDGRRDYRKQELFNYIVARLNQKYSELSPT